MLVPCDLLEVLRRPDDLSKRYTVREGCRSLGILHMATALHLGARELLTFDENQRVLAAVAGLVVSP